MTLDQILQVGNTIRLFYSEGNTGNALLHVRAIVDGDQVVTREWHKYRQRWFYKIDSRMRFSVLLEEGFIAEVNGSTII